MGRNTFSILAAMKLDAITVDYVIVDTVRGPQKTFAAILTAWRGGYSEPIGEATSVSHESAEAYFEHMIANTRDPLGYAVLDGSGRKRASTIRMTETAPRGLLQRSLPLLPHTVL